MVMTDRWRELTRESQRIKACKKTLKNSQRNTKKTPTSSRGASLLLSWLFENKCGKNVEKAFSFFRSE
jgi:hypothetical protein